MTAKDTECIVACVMSGDQKGKPERAMVLRHYTADTEKTSDKCRSFPLQVPDDNDKCSHVAESDTQEVAERATRRCQLPRGYNS